MKIALLTEFFNHPVEERQRELEASLEKNIGNPSIDVIYILHQEETEIPSFLSQSSKVRFYPIEKRATFSQFFKVINEIFSQNTICMISNLDMSYDASLEKLKSLNWKNTFVCLTRWNLKGYADPKDGKPIPQKALQHNPNDSHDTWITAEPVSQWVIENTNFNLGIPGCDNKLTYILQTAGYHTINPCNDIISYHNHLTGGYQGHRTYSKSMRLKGPYGKVKSYKLQ